MNLDRLLSVWLHGFSPLTVRYYKRTVTALAKWLGSVSILDSTPEDLVGFLDSVKWTVTMVEQTKVVLRSFFAFCIDGGYVAANPARFLRLSPPRFMVAERIPTREAVTAVCDASEDLSSNPFVKKRNRILCEFAYTVGARRAELAALRLSHLQPVGQALQVQLIGKGSRKRWIPLSVAFSNQLLEWMKSHGFDAVFPTVHGVPLTPHGVAGVIKQAAVKAGYPRFSTHWFRHAHASFSIENGCPLPVVQATLGHSNVATTSRYLHARPSTSSALYLSLSPVKETTFLATNKTRKETHEQVTK